MVSKQLALAQALLTVADTCSNTGRFPPEEALQAARRRYELARGRLQSGSCNEQGDSPTRTGDLFATPRASPRASRPGAFGGVSKLTAQQRRARHRCNNPWYDLASATPSPVLLQKAAAFLWTCSRA